MLGIITKNIKIMFCSYIYFLLIASTKVGESGRKCVKLPAFVITRC